MIFEALKTFDLDDNFKGWIIVSHTPKGDFRIEGNWVYSKNDLTELNKKLEFLNEAALLREHWPDPDDPEVQALLADKTFEPVEMKQQAVVDQEKSKLYYDEFGEPIYNLSDLVYKTILAPSPAAEFERINKACEKVATERAGLISAK